MRNSYTIFNRIRRSFWFPSFIVWLFGFLITIIMIFGSSKAIKMMEYEFPTGEKLVRIQTNITIAHLWIEELIEGDKNESIPEVLSNIENAKALLNSLIDLPFEDSSSEISSKVIEIREKINQFQSIGFTRIEQNEYSKAGSSIDQKQDRVFREIVLRTEELIKLIQNKRDKNFTSFKTIRIVAISSILVTITLLGILILIYNKRKLKNYQSLENSFIELKEAKEEIDVSEKRFRSYINAAPNGIFVTDQTGNNLDVNPAANKLTGYSYDELLSMNINDLIPQEELENAHSHFDRLIKKSESFWGSRFLNKSGEIGYCLVSSVKLDENIYLSFADDITEYKKAEEELRESEHLLKTFVANVNGIVFIVDNDGIFKLSAGRGLSELGLKPGQVVGLSVYDVYKEIPQIEKDIRNALHGDEITSVVNVGPLVYEVIFSPLIDETTKVTGVLGVAINISERRLAEKALKESEAKYRALFNNIADPVVIFDMSTHLFLDCNKSMLDRYGYTIDELRKMTPFQLHPKEEFDTVEKNIDNLGDQSSHTYTHITKNGEIIFVDVHTAEVSYNGKNAWISIIRDITERIKVEEAIRASEERYKNFISQVTEGVYRFEVDGPMDINLPVEEQIDYLYDHLILAECNPVFIEMNSIKDKTDIIGKTQKDLHGGSTNPDKREAMAKFINSGYRTENVITEEINNNGNKKSFRNNAIGIIRDNQLVRMWGTQTDITEQRKAEKDLVESERKYRLLAENSLDFIWELDMEMNVVYSSNSVYDLLGYTVDEMLKLNIADLYNPDGFKKIAAIISQEINNGAPHKGTTLEALHLHKDGYEFPVEIKGKIIFNETGEPIAIQGYTRDITDRKNTLAELITAKEEAERADKLKSIFLAQMSHEIRTPINAMVSLSSLLQEDLEDQVDEDQKISFQMVNRAGMRIIRTVDLLLNLSEIQAGTYEIIHEKFNIYSDVLVKILVDYKKLCKEKNLKLNTIIETDDTEIIADSYTVNQIFTQLIDNAIKYTDQGKIIVRIVRNIEDKLIIEISDTGIGINKEYLPELFEPFSQEEMGYTRKYEGNGIGLTLVKKYCDMNNAEIMVESEKGNGTTFRVIF